jgi:hypothetical protein
MTDWKRPPSFMDLPPDVARACLWRGQQTAGPSHAHNHRESLMPHKPETYIVKVQLSLNRKSPALVYDQEKAHMVFMSLPGPVVQAFNRKKAFFNATWNGEKWDFGTLAPWQDW